MQHGAGVGNIPGRLRDAAIQESRAAKRHRDAIDQGKTCIDCHKGIAHELPAGAFEAEQELIPRISDKDP